VIRLLQRVALLLNQTPLRRVFSHIYEVALRRVVAALSRHPAVFCILGTGSYFEKRATYGFSDIDLIIVLNEKITRADGATGEIAYIYERVRRIFPFLGPWAEREANLVFLHEIAAGFPVPERLRVRFKQDRLVPLYGELPRDIFSGGAVTTSELLNEIGTLLRLTSVAERRYTGRLLFWKHIFTKLNALGDQLDLKDWSKEVRERPELSFLKEDDTPLFVRKCEPAALFALQVVLSRQIFDLIAQREPRVKIHPVVMQAHPPEVEPASRRTPVPFLSALNRTNELWFSQRNIPAAHLALVFGLAIQVDQCIPLLEFREAAYDGLHRLRYAEQRAPAAEETALVLADGFLFIAVRKEALVEVVPLDPVQFANVYATVFGDRLEFEIPASILAEQQAAAAAMFRGFANMYRVDGALVTKRSQPCIYREHDAEVIESALRLLQARVASAPEWTLIPSSSGLFGYFRKRYPECEYFLSELERFRSCLSGDMSRGEATANNLYNCLHQFMSQVLSDTQTIALDSPHKHLGITVGVITRNRAGDLAEMLDSLTRQRRPPDEVLVVDNGSTDRTQAVLEEFRTRLPLQCHFLERADIPGARNLVIEKAAHEIVSFIDDDCISEPEWLAAIEVGFLRAENIGIVGGLITHQPASRPSAVDTYYRLFHHFES